MMSLCILVFLQAPAADRMTPRPSQPANSQISPEQLERFNRALQGLLTKALPEPLYEKSTGDGNMASAVNGLKWRGFVPKVQYADKNDGTRRHMKLTSDNPAQNFHIEMKNWRLYDEGRATFDLQLKLAARMDFNEEHWTKGIKLYDGTVRARAKLWMVLHCESKMRIEADGFLPTIVYRLRVVDTEFGYTDLIFEHVAGLGGEAAKLVGDFAVDALRQWKPSIERKLREKLERSIMKAADAKEIRIGLTSFSFGKKKDPLPSKKTFEHPMQQSEPPKLENTPPPTAAARIDLTLTA